MKSTRFSMKTNILLTTFCMGIIGMLLVFLTSSFYRRIAVEEQAAALQKIIHHKVEDALAETREKGITFGLSIQKDPYFRKAFGSKDATQITPELDEHFKRFLVVTGQLKVERLFVYDTKATLVAVSSEGKSFFDAAHIPCPEQILLTATRKGASRIKPWTKACHGAEGPLMNVFVPVGGLRPKGFLQVVLDPVENLRLLESRLDLALRISSPSGISTYVSDTWQKVARRKGIKIVPFTVEDKNNVPMYKLELAYDATAFYAKLVKTRNIILLATGGATLFAAIFSILWLKKTTLQPLEHLTLQLRRVRKDKKHLGETVDLDGCKEISVLAEDFNDMSLELKQMYLTLEEMAFKDSLTGLANRDLFYDRLNQCLLVSRRTKSVFAVCMMDIDRFKIINDTLGHHIGDLLLKQVATRLRQTVRASDTIARLGGDEYASLLTEVSNIDDVDILSKRLISAMEDPFLIEGHNLKTGISLGLSLFPKDGTDSNTLLKCAEVAMYHAKTNRHGYDFYASKFDKHSVNELELESDLKEAISQDQLQLFYQPKVDLQNDSVFGVEALIRWEHPKQGMLPPDLFIPLAEQTDLIDDLTRWVLATALKQSSLWRQSGFHLNMAVNISATSLSDNHLGTLVQRVLSENKVDPSELTLELTETAVMVNPQQALDILSDLDLMGVRLSIDDFGTGYSSLAYLKKLPVDEIKIDRSFVMDMDRDKNDTVIVQSTVDLAHNMGLKVVAEGIETAETQETLAKLKCDLGQGYHICRPANAKKLTEWLIQRAAHGSEERPSSVEAA